MSTQDQLKELLYRHRVYIANCIIGEARSWEDVSGPLSDYAKKQIKFADDLAKEIHDLVILTSAYGL